MQTDRYYRGYRVSVPIDNERPVTIWHDAEFVSDATSEQNARDIIDDWMEAR